MMKPFKSLSAVAVLILLTSGTTLAWAMVVGPSLDTALPDGATRVHDSILSSARGTLPNYALGDNGQCKCEIAYEDLVNNVEAACHCFTAGDTCIACRNGFWVLTGFFKNPGSNTIQPSGGANVDCSSSGADKWVGVCDGNGACAIAVNANVKCTLGSYPPFTFQQ